MVAALALPLGLAAAYYGLPFCVEAPDISPPADTAVYDRHGELLGFVPAADGYRCLPLKEAPAQLEQALLTAEDKRFYSHGGIDFLAILRAIRQHLSQESRSGASTLTMQVAKMYSPPALRNWGTKIREALQARRLEMTHSKQELLLAYLNRADFGHQCRGAEAAARFYFGKAAHQLTPAQASTLIALLKAPSRLNPLRHPQAALQRRNYILRRMGKPTDDPLAVAAHSLAAPPAAAGKPGRLTLDAALQRSVETIAREETEKLLRYNVTQAAVVVADNRTGELLACLPASRPQSQRGGGMDGTCCPRSAGSTLKPFVYLMAFQHGAWPGTILADVPTLYANSAGIQAPRNYDEQYDGPITIRRALACSRNIPAMDTLENYGGVENLLGLLRNLGFTPDGSAAEYGLGLAIGNAHVSLTELAQAFSTLARNGMHLPLQRRLPLQSTTPIEKLPAQHCYRISHILADRSARAAAFGEAPSLSFSFPVAAKTGTSSNYRDNWCVGYTAEFTVGVWVGNFDNSAMEHISGVSGAGPIFHRVMLALHESTPATFPARPHGLTDICIDTRTGARAQENTPAECRATELATEEDAARLPAGNYDARGRALLSSRYSEWYATAGQEHLYTLDAAAPGERSAAILIPSPGTTLVLDSPLPNNGRYLELQSTLPPATTQWHSNTLPIIFRNGKWYAELLPGTHSIYATAPESEPAESTFHVISD